MTVFEKGKKEEKLGAENTVVLARVGTNVKGQAIYHLSTGEPVLSECNLGGSIIGVTKAAKYKSGFFGKLGEENFLRCKKLLAVPGVVNIRVRGDFRQVGLVFVSDRAARCPVACKKLSEILRSFFRKPSELRVKVVTPDAPAPPLELSDVNLVVHAWPSS